MTTPIDYEHEIAALKIQVEALQKQLTLVAKFADHLSGSVIKLIEVTQELVDEVYKQKKTSVEDTIV